MKKLLFIVSFLFAVNLYSQNVQWSVESKLTENILNSMYGTSGSYLGEVGNVDFYVFAQKEPSFFDLPGKVFSFIKVKDNKVIQSSKFTKDYMFIDIDIIDKQIGILYYEEKSYDTFDLKIDYYSLSTLELEKTRTIFSFISDDENSNFVSYAASPDKSTKTILTQEINPESEESELFIHVFDNNFYEKYYKSTPIDFKNNQYLGKIQVFNNGPILFDIKSTHDVSYNPVFNDAIFYMVDESGLKQLSLTDQSITNPSQIPKYDDIAYMNTGKFQFKVITSFNMCFRIFNLDFKKKFISEPIVQNSNKGTWKIDNILHLSNGNQVFCFANRTIEFNTQFLKARTNSNKSIQLICLNPTSDEIIYQCTLNRYCNIVEGSKSPYGNLKNIPFYTTKEDEVIVIYNTEPDLKKYISINGSDKGEVSEFDSKKIVTIFAKIDNLGFFRNKTIHESDNNKDIFIGTFSHKDKNEKIVISKAKKNKITFGVITL